MQKLFKKILVPVDFTERSAKAVQQAVQLIDAREGAICLLYICKPLFSLNIFFDTGYIVAPASEILTASEIDQKFAVYVSMIAQKVPRIKIDTMVLKSGRSQQKIEEAAAVFAPDLIVISHHGERRFLFTGGQISLEKIAKNTECAIFDMQVYSKD